MPSEWEYEAELHRIKAEARSQRNAYFEKLAILDGGTVALVITAVLGPLHGTIRHRYTLGAGLSLLVVAMLLLLRRNYVAVNVESLAAASTAARSPVGRQYSSGMLEHIRRTEIAGLLLSAAGIVLLLIEVWLILL